MIRFCLFVTVSAILGSCGISIDFQKRKHLSGYQLNINKVKARKNNRDEAKSKAITFNSGAEKILKEKLIYNPATDVAAKKSNNKSDNPAFASLTEDIKVSFYANNTIGKKHYLKDNFTYGIRKSNETFEKQEEKLLLSAVLSFLLSLSLIPLILLSFTYLESIFLLPILALLLSFFFGILALRKIDKSPNYKGSVLAMSGVVISLVTLILVLFLIFIYWYFVYNI